MFVFILEVLDGNGPGSSGPGSFFSLEKATLSWQHKKGCYHYLRRVTVNSIEKAKSR